jgi:hypothetical protein
MRACLLALTLFLSGCTAAAPDDGRDAAAMRERDDFVACVDPRPELCTQEYVPVCALRVTGTPCDAEPCAGGYERVTRPNRCVACTDPAVVGWIPGACGADPVDSPLYLDP